MDTAQRKAIARQAGLWYLVQAITGPIAILAMPSEVVVPGDVAATAQQIVDHAAFVRIGVGAMLVCQVAFVFTALGLHRLLRDVGPELARTMLTLVIAAVPIGVLSELLPLGALTLLTSEGVASGMPTGTPQAGALFLFELYQHAIVLVGLFWGLWLLPLGLLVWRSGFIPRWIGALLVAGFAAYLLDVAIFLLAPALRPTVQGALMIPLSVGELSTIVWLVGWGVREAPPAAPPVA